MLRIRYAFLARPRSKLSEKQRMRHEELRLQEVSAHEGRHFIAETDIRTLAAFKKGEVRTTGSDGGPQ